MSNKWYQISFDDFLKSEPGAENNLLLVWPKEFEQKKPPFWDGFGEELSPPPNENKDITGANPCQ